MSTSQRGCPDEAPPAHDGLHANVGKLANKKEGEAEVLYIIESLSGLVLGRLHTWF